MSRRQPKAGDTVEVRSAREILATLDERGRLEEMPFMPEMLRYIGQRLTVYRVAERVCDTINQDDTSRHPVDTVFLGDQHGPRCDGSGHDGCQAECRILWKTAWLKVVADASSPPPAAPDEEAMEALTRLVTAGATNGSAGDALRYSCQATQLVEASNLLKVYDPRPYVRELTARNIRLGRWTKVMGRAAVMQTAWKLGRLKHPVLVGDAPTTPITEPLDLQPGELVRVRSPEEIEATLNDKGRNRGLWFDREMLEFCGGVYRVRKRVTRIIGERDGKMVTLASDCIMLQGVVCSGERSTGRWFCWREIPCYWRESWLERIDPPSAAS